MAKFGWQGGYEQRGPRAVKKGPCPECGELYWNEGAHAEACSGSNISIRRGCGVRRVSGFNTWTYCILAPGHQGAHHYFTDET